MEEPGDVIGKKQFFVDLTPLPGQEDPLEAPQGVPNQSAEPPKGCRSTFWEPGSGENPRCATRMDGLPLTAGVTARHSVNGEETSPARDQPSLLILIHQN